MSYARQSSVCWLMKFSNSIMSVIFPIHWTKDDSKSHLFLTLVCPSHVISCWQKSGENVIIVITKPLPWRGALIASFPKFVLWCILILEFVVLSLWLLQSPGPVHGPLYSPALSDRYTCQLEPCDIMALHVCDFTERLKSVCIIWNRCRLFHI